MEKRLLILHQQEVGDDLDVCVVNLLPDVTTLPSLVAMSFMKLDI